MDIVWIGSGNVATVLGRLMKSSGHRILQVLSRHQANAAALAGELGGEAGDFSVPPLPDADIYIISLSDEALASGAFSYRLPGKLVVHTAGSVSRLVLKSVSERNGVLYPLQSLRRELAHIPEIPLLVDAADPDDLAILKGFAGSLSSKVSGASDDERLKLHTAAVIVNNFSNHLYALAEQFCERSGVDFHLLAPLIRETAERISLFSPAALQTGPAIRHDLLTIEKHIELLSGFPEILKIYKQLSDSIHAFGRGK